MHDTKKTPASIDEYIANFPLEIQEKLNKIRVVIKESAPEAKEKISYQMPAFDLHGIVVYFAAFKNHIGFFPTASGVEAFLEELTSFKCSKGTVQFPYNRDVPYELVSRIVKFRVAENTRRAELKKKKK